MLKSYKTEILPTLNVHGMIADRDCNAALNLRDVKTYKIA